LAETARRLPAPRRAANYLARLAGRRVVVISAAGVLAAAGLASGLVVALSSGGPKVHHREAGHGLTVPQPPLIPVRVTRHLCPLTGQRAGHGRVPARPAIGVKIGNDPASRPQSGLQAADIVYEEMAEGGITRYLALFQCRQVASLGPVRSVRWDDWHVLATYGHPILAFAGGILPWENVVAHLGWLHDANAFYYPAANAFHRTTNRVPPWNLYTSTEALWRLDPRVHTPPPMQFRYRSAPPKGSVRSSGVTVVGFASGSNVVWRWNPLHKAFERSYGSTPDRDASGQQLHATNVVVEVVRGVPGPVESGVNGREVESIIRGHGPAFVFTGGKVERGTWRTFRYGERPHLRFGDGRPMALEPGNTWVELVPAGYKVVVSK
jgi:hypothetical protein